MGYTTPTQFEVDTYRRYFYKLVTTLPYLHHEKFLTGCIDGGLLATRTIPNITGGTINKFEPIHFDQANLILLEEEEKALSGASFSTTSAYATGYCIGFFMEAWVRNKGIMFLREKLALHAMALAQIVVKNPPERLQRDIFVSIAKDSIYVNDDVVKKNVDAFIEILQKSGKTQ